MWTDDTVNAMLIALTMVGGPAGITRGEEEGKRGRDMEARQEDRVGVSGDAVTLRSGRSSLTHTPGAG